MFGLGDAFLNTIVDLLRRLPAYPMFGRGETKLQVFVNVALAIATGLQRTESRRSTFECAGPRIYSYDELLRNVARAVNVRPRLLPVPFAAWHLLARFAEWLPTPPITRNQVELMQVDTVPHGTNRGLPNSGSRRAQSKKF